LGRTAPALLAAFAVITAACGHNTTRIGVRPPAGRTALVAIAASDAVGLGATNPDRDNWVAQLSARLPSITRVVNLGISGATAAQAAQQELPVALDAAPTVAVVWLGVNDFQDHVSLDDFSRNLAQILSDLRQHTVARVFVGNLPDLRLLPDFAGRDPAALAAEVDRWNAAIAGIAAEQGAQVVDIYTAWSRLRESASLVSGDGLHPNSAGYQRIADLFYQQIQAG
jgi:lysophospholipase L1-like esterase